MSTFPFSILTPDGKVFDQLVSSIKIPGADGYFGVMARHAPLMTLVVEGTVTVRTEQGLNTFSVGNGVLEVGPEKTALLADFANQSK